MLIEMRLSAFASVLCHQQFCILSMLCPLFNFDEHPPSARRTLPRRITPRGR